MKNLQNLYEVRKTVRFLAQGKTQEIINFLEIDKKQGNDKKYDLLGSFLLKFESLVSLNNKLFFYENSGNLKDSFKIKYKFLQNHTKYDFYDMLKKPEYIREKPKDYSFKDLNFIEKFLKEYFELLDNIYNNLNNYQSAKKEKQNRYREIGFYLQKLSGKNISILKDLFEFLLKTNKKYIDDKIEEIKKIISEFEKDLVELLKEFGPNNGLEIAKGSFNYYILNKSSKSYFDDEILKLKNKQKYNLPKDIFTLKERDKQDVYLNETFFQNIGLSKNELENMTLENAYNFLKDFKAKRKSAFNQFVGNGYTHYDLTNKTKGKYKYKQNGELKEEEMSVELFDDIGETHFEDFKKLTDEINGLGKEINDILQPLDKKRKDYEKEITKKKIEERTEEENNFMKLSKKVQDKAKERGKYFNIPNEKIYTKNYKSLCEFYKNIALKLGLNKSKILGYEKQIVDSEKLKFFSVIVEKGNDKFLVLIPKGGENHHKKAYDFLNDEKNNNSNGNINIYSFKSLTLRALQKLCFKAEDKEVLIGEENLNSKERNTFIKNIIDELSGNQETQNKKYLYNGKIKRFDEFKIYDKYEKDKTKWQFNEKLLIEFYKDVLKTKSAKKVLDLKDFGLDNILNENFETLDEFELTLEKVAYVKNITKLDENGYKNFIEKNKAFEYKINSQDLSINDENHKNKKHTNYWLEFWTDHNKNKDYDIRINPEFSLYYTLSDEDLKDKKENGLLKDGLKVGFKNRKLENQLIFTTNFSLNANEKLQNLAFLETPDLKENINKFNENLETHISKNDLWYFGIDRGINELATLSITKFLDTKNENQVNKFEFAKINCLKLKDEYDKILDIKVDEKGNTKYEFKKLEFEDKNGYKREFAASKNISYFLPKIEIFESITTGIIDLTQAKLIGDKIVLNGDKSTLLKLKELSAKRRLFEYHREIDKNSEFEVVNKNKNSNGGLFIKLINGNYIQIYWFNENLSITSQEKKELKNYKENLQSQLIEIFKKYLTFLSEENKFEDLETILKINHLRDAISSNIVGIINFLMIKKGYFGKIVLENLDETIGFTGLERNKTKNGKFENLKEYTGEELKMIDGHFYQSNTDISRRLEWSLYRKFQETGFVPPEIKQSIFLKDDFGINKFGIIEFVKTGGTSSTCPYCQNCNENFGNKDGLKKHHEKNDCGFTKQSGEYLEFKNKDNSINYDSIASFTIGKFAFEGKFGEFEKNKKIISYGEYKESHNKFESKNKTHIIEFKRKK
ncbi:MAG: hypothetical protein PHE25_05470 [Candidatus Gracilibacteria bacterium]|nr:hypothetical protein [Candidatus Gracilibacteria bacterium]